MSILSGYKRFKKYLRTADGYKLCSEWTKSDSVEMTDGRTLQEAADSIANDVESTQHDITDIHNELKTSLGGMTFGVDAAGRYGYIKAGADTVTPFKKNDWETLSTENIKEYRWSGNSGKLYLNGGYYTFRSPSAGEIATKLGITDPDIAAGCKIIGVKDLGGVTMGYGGVRGISLDTSIGSGGTISITFKTDGDMRSEGVTASFYMTILVYIPS